MKKNLLAMVITVIVVFACIKCACEPRCAMPGCSKKCTRDSNYCYLHAPYMESDSSSTSDSSSSTGSTGTNHKYSWDSSYDDGYDDIDLDGDFDYDRYNKDSDYAAGVDDAMDDLGYDG